jgi:hypothetical protein
MLQTVSGESFPILKEIFLTLSLLQRPLKIQLFVISITNEFILGLDILRSYDVSVDLGPQTLHLAEEGVSLWHAGAGPRLSSLVVASDQVIPGTMQGNGDGLIGEPPWSRKWRGRTKSGGPFARRTT